MLWSHDKELTINVTKTEILHITSPNVFKTGKVKILTHEIECLHVQNPQNWSRCDCQKYTKQVKFFKYLGVYIDENINWNKHIDILCKKVSLCAMKLNNLKWVTPTNIMLQIYYGLIVSILNYGIAVWAQASATQIQRVQRLQNKCLRAVCWKNKK